MTLRCHFAACMLAADGYCFAAATLMVLRYYAMPRRLAAIRLYAISIRHVLSPCHYAAAMLFAADFRFR